jgi:hypothetical protein
VATGAGAGAATTCAWDGRLDGAIWSAVMLRSMMTEFSGSCDTVGSGGVCAAAVWDPFIGAA